MITTVVEEILSVLPLQLDGGTGNEGAVLDGGTGLEGRGSLVETSLDGSRSLGSEVLVVVLCLETSVEHLGVDDIANRRGQGQGSDLELDGEVQILLVDQVLARNGDLDRNIEAVEVCDDLSGEEVLSILRLLLACLRVGSIVGVDSQEVIGEVGGDISTELLVLEVVSKIAGDRSGKCVVRIGELEGGASSVVGLAVILVGE